MLQKRGKDGKNRRKTEFYVKSIKKETSGNSRTGKIIVINNLTCKFSSRLKNQRQEQKTF